MSSGTLTIPLSSDLEARLGALSDETSRPATVLAAEALERYVAHETGIIESLHRALDDEQAGNLVSHSRVLEEANAIISESTSSR